MRIRPGTPPGESGLQLGEGDGVVDVASVEEDVARGQGGLGVVRVRDADDGHRVAG